MPARTIAAIALLTILSAGVFAQSSRRPAQQPLEDGTSTIAGTVVDAQSKEPVVNAEITVSALTNGMSTRGGVVKTGADGTFGISDIGEGTYMLMVRAPGYLNTMCSGPDGAAQCGPINLLRDQKRTDVHYLLTRTATARGRVVDQSGAPVAGATIRMGSPQQPRNEIARTVLFANSSTMSDADGSFELRDVPPGQWNLELELKTPSGSMKVPILFYPGVLRNEDATQVEFTPGRVTDKLMFVVPAITENKLAIRVSPGVLPIGDVRATLIQRVPYLSKPIALNDEGIGAIKGLLEGRYYIAARGWIKDKAWAAYEIADFLSPSLDLSLQLAPAGSIAGRIVAKNGGLPPLSGVIAAATWVDQEEEINPVTPDQVPVAADGSFRIEGLFGTRTLQLIFLDAGWRIDSILVGRSAVSSIDVPPDTTVDVTVIVARQ